MQLLTLGHGTASQDELAALIRAAEIAQIVDVRTVPKSARHPQFRREAMEAWVPQGGGAAYAWEPELGGFRRPAEDSRNAGLRHPAFRGYADYMQTETFRKAIQRMLEIARAKKTAVMCSESLWWRCHRRLVADYAVLVENVAVEHLFHNGALKPHVPTPEARVIDRQLVYEHAA
ncbi:MAG: DNA repair protein [Candidatus Meridianibacter frigidus]|nr:MAG: DNA repair protein [Candidatus Eremiobacteraeota bacterium]